MLHRCTYSHFDHRSVPCRLGGIFLFHPVKDSKGAVFWEKANHDISEGSRSFDP